MPARGCVVVCGLSILKCLLEGGCQAIMVQLSVVSVKAIHHVKYLVFDDLN